MSLFVLTAMFMWSVLCFPAKVQMLTTVDSSFKASIASSEEGSERSHRLASEFSPTLSIIASVTSWHDNNQNLVNALYTDLIERHYFFAEHQYQERRLLKDANVRVHIMIPCQDEIENIEVQDILKRHHVSEWFVYDHRSVNKHSLPFHIMWQLFVSDRIGDVKSLHDILDNE